MSGSILVLAHFAATVAMTGLVWFVQIVHYPLFARVGAPGFPEYEAAHARRTTLVVGPPMLVEAATALLLLVPAARPDSVPGGLPAIAAALLAVVWLVTALASVPAHRRLEAGFDPDAHARLVSTNWIRTLGWTARAGIAFAMAAAATAPG